MGLVSRAGCRMIELRDGHCSIGINGKNLLPTIRNRIFIRAALNPPFSWYIPRELSG